MNGFDHSRHNERNLRPNERLAEVVRFRPTFCDLLVLHVLNLFFWVRDWIKSRRGDFQR